jgi:N-acetylglucosamine-6-phosphate deacetylase
MKIRRCLGRDPASGRVVEVTFGETVVSVDESDASTGLYLAPGFIDLQVNGFAGVEVPAEESDRA